MIACDVDDRFFIATYIVVDGVLSIFPPGTNGEIFMEVEIPVVTTSAMTPLPAAGSSPTLREASAVLDALSVYSLNHPAVDSPTFINKYDLNPVTLIFPIALLASDPVVPETTVLELLAAKSTILIVPTIPP